MIPVVHLEPAGCWDETQINDLLDTLPVWHCEPGEWPIAEGIILVVPGRHHSARLAEITASIEVYAWVLCIRIGDEEDWFDVHQIAHPNIRYWVQTPRTDRDYADARLFGVGYAPHLKLLAGQAPPERPTDVFLAAQDTHERRHQCFAALSQLSGLNVIGAPSPGFTQGLAPTRYVAGLASAKIAPAPAGPVSPDTFRLYEALEAHAVPIADDVCPGYPSTGYWHTVLGADLPFPVITDWGVLPQLVPELLAGWPANANRITAWWMRYKAALAARLRQDVGALRGAELPAPPISVVIPVSPIASHPDTAILDETVSSVRHWLPDAPILLTFDGVRPEQEHLRGAYEEHIARALWNADHGWTHTRAWVFDEHRHQVGMLRAVIEEITTPLLLYVEADCPLITDADIDWDEIVGLLTDGQANLVRLAHEAQIPDAHQHLMHGPLGEHFTRTSQWSQRPHVATVDLYRRVLDQFSASANCFIEDRMHGVVQLPEDRWDEWKLALYTPAGDHIKRSHTLDGRAGAAKYDELQRF